MPELSALRFKNLEILHLLTRFALYLLTIAFNVALL